MQAIIICAFLALAAAQLGFNPLFLGKESDRHAGYYFQYHARHNLLLVRDARHCYLIKASKDIATKYHDKAAQDGLEDDIIKHIKADSPKKLGHFEALKEFHDPLEAAECRSKTIYELTYSV